MSGLDCCGGSSLLAIILVTVKGNLSTMALERPSGIPRISDMRAESNERSGRVGTSTQSEFALKASEKSGSANFPMNTLSMSGGRILFSNILETFRGAIVFPNASGMLETCSRCIRPSIFPTMFIVGGGSVDPKGSCVAEVDSGRRNGWKGERTGELREVGDLSYLDVMLKRVPNADLSEEGFLFRRTGASLCPSSSEPFRAPLSFLFIVEDEIGVYIEECIQSLRNGGKRV